MLKRWIASAVLLVHLAAQPAYAWDAVGHEVIARIAWENLTPRARAAAVALLSNAPTDSGIRDLYPRGGTRATSDRRFFVQTAVWSDLVRDNSQPARRDRYARSPWHYVNYFFEDTPQGPRDRTDLRPDTAHVVERLGELQASVVDVRRPSAQRAVDLAWILHLVGDIHQPLHTTARSTPASPNGDQGGNACRMEGTNLHSYWDGLVDDRYPPTRGESQPARVDRIARTLMQKHPRSTLAAQLQPGAYEAWAREGFALAKSQVYPGVRCGGGLPSSAYRQAAFATAERAATLAGYRMAAVLNSLLDPAARPPAGEDR